MDRTVKWTLAAADDLANAAKYIERDSPVYAAVLAGKILRAAESLASMSERGRKVPEWEDRSVRELFVMGHRLIYQTTNGAVYILAVVHGARRLGADGPREGVPRCSETQAPYRARSAKRKKRKDRKGNKS